MLCAINLDSYDQNSPIHYMVLLERRFPYSLRLQNLNIVTGKTWLHFYHIFFFIKEVLHYSFYRNINFVLLHLFFCIFNFNWNLQKISWEHAMMLPICIYVLVKMFLCLNSVPLLTLSSKKTCQKLIVSTRRHLISWFRLEIVIGC
jgi:hypothetical protein